MDFRQLESFVAIVKHGSFTKAAEGLFLTQPTLTGHIQSLENELGTVLLNRCVKTVTLTEAGEILYSAVNILNSRARRWPLAVKGSSRGSAIALALPNAILPPFGRL